MAPVIVIFGDDGDERDTIARAITKALNLRDRTDDRVPRIIGIEQDYHQLMLTGCSTSY